MEKRDETLCAKFSKKEARMIERVAKSQGVTIGAFLRAASLSSCVLEGDREAMVYFGKLYFEHLAKRGAEVFGTLEKVTV